MRGQLVSNDRDLLPNNGFFYLCLIRPSQDTDHTTESEQPVRNSNTQFFFQEVNILATRNERAVIQDLLVQRDICFNSGDDQFA